MAKTKHHFSADVDAYIEKAAPFARPILKRLRRLYHKACPEIQEVMKWGFPHFEHKGIVGSMAAFKQHATYSFWKAPLLQDSHGILKAVGNTSMGAMKLSSVDELPADEILLEYITEAIALNEAGKKVARPKKKSAANKVLEVPDDLAAALKKNKTARAVFEAFSNSHRKEYIEWITEAKLEATRQKRLTTTIDWLSNGKPRNWKYMK